MKYLFLLLFLWVFLIQSFPVYPQLKKTQQTVVSQQRQLPAFTGIVASGTMNLILSQSDSVAVKIETEENIIESVKTIVDGQILKIDIIEDQKKAKVLNVYISVSNISLIVLLGSVNTKCDTDINASEISVLASGTTVSDIRLNAEKIEIDVSDAAFLKIAGNCEMLKLRASDDSEVDAFGLQTGVCKMRASGFSDVKLNIQTNLDIMVTGGGNVYYIGDPVINSRIFAGSGFIVKRRN